jgi:site-specific recombinase XerC
MTLSDLFAAIDPERQHGNLSSAKRAVQHYLGHKNIQHTIRYTALSPDRFKSFWED